MKKLIGICTKIGNVKTVTLDNDQSFAKHYRLNRIGIRTFFTHPYSSQEKGSVENRIGIIRMFFPKKTDFRQVNEQQVRTVSKKSSMEDHYVCLITNAPMKYIYPDPIKLKK